MASRMGVPMTVKEELHKLIDALDDIEAAEVLAQMRWLLSDGDTLSDEALEQVGRGEEEIARGEYVTLNELRSSVAV
jgi:hypothetical protein